jgi:GAF domain-containing protein
MDGGSVRDMVQDAGEAAVISLEQLLSRVKSEGFRERCQEICGALRSLDARYDWVGIYWLEGDVLVLGPWSGRHATEHVRIPVSEGICGAAVREEGTVVVDDVRGDPRYLACFTDTRSEIVVPIRASGRIIGEIDVDGREIAAYDERDRRFLESLADHIGTLWPGRW